MWRPEIESELKTRRDVAKSGGGFERFERQRRSGKLTARERIELLFDSGSFEEIDPLEKNIQRNDCLKVESTFGDGVIIGQGKINGRLVCTAVEDFTIHGGTFGECHARRFIRILKLARKLLVPFIMICDSGGARIEEGVHSLNGYSGLFYQNTKASGRIPQIAVVLGPCAGGACYSPAICDFIFMVKGTSKMFITGPKVIEEVTGVTTDAETLGGADVHGPQSGVAHFVYDNETECFEGIKQLLSFLPQNYEDELPLTIKKEPSETALLQDSVPEGRRISYDIHCVINSIFDEASFFEVHSQFALNMVVGFARLNGCPCGIIANQPKYMAGAIDVDASDKAARFIRFCDCFHIPMFVLVDTPGFLPSSDQEQKGIIRHGAKILFAFSESTVPKITLILRKAYGGAYIAMNSKGLGADMVFSWPLAEIAVMGEYGAVEILYSKQIKFSSNPESEKQRLLEQYRNTMLSPYICAENGYIDDVIMPEETREKLIRTMTCLRSPIKRTKFETHGNIPL